MIRMLLVPAALAAITLPAASQAQQFVPGPAFDSTAFESSAFESSAFSGDHREHLRLPERGSADHRDRRGSSFGCGGGGGDRRHDGDGRRSNACDGGFGPWAYYDQDINDAWRSDSYNDWWHDRPDRAFPRWVRHNQNCEPERMWWSGDGWHC